MTLTHMQERLRLELLRRIQRGSLSVSLLARQTGFGQSHLSNFLHARRQLSLQGLDRILEAQRLHPSDLLHGSSGGANHLLPGNESVPVVSAATAMFEPYIRAAATAAVLQAPTGVLQDARSRCPPQRKAWQRFVAVIASAGDAHAMNPIVQPQALVLLDRHYNSLSPHRADRPNLYAVRSAARLVIRYLDFRLDRLVLRPHNTDCAVDLIELEPSETHGDLIVGRVILILNEM